MLFSLIVIVLFFVINRISNQLTSNIAAFNLTSNEYQSDINELIFKYFEISNGVVKNMIFLGNGDFYVLTDPYNNLARIYQIYFKKSNSAYYIYVASFAESLCSITYFTPLLSKLDIILVSCFSFLFFVIVVAIIILIKIKIKNKNSKYIQLPEYKENTIKNNLELIYKDNTIPKIASNHLKIGETIGYGGQSLIRKGEYRGKTVAIKSLFNLRKNEFSEFIREIKLLSSFKHENILKINGICIYGNELL